MTYKEYLAQIKVALKNLDKSDKEAVHRFNTWREELYKQIDDTKGGTR